MKWQTELQKSVRTAEELLPYMRLPPNEQRQMTAILEQYPLAIPHYYVNLINFDDPDDPIRKMAIPSLAETDLGGSFDTSGEASNTVIEGLQHKYPETALLLSTNQCAMYCRHCFRKRLVGLSDGEIAKNFGRMRAYILAHTEINNVLVSGGDALLNSNARLAEIFDMLTDIPHLQAIRLASRVPVVFPARILEDDELHALLAKTNKKKQLYFITQFNHPNEITPEAQAAVQRLLGLGIPVKNQTVLLRGVNDNPEVLGALLGKLIRIGVVPYYIFQCRPVTGVKGQFQVPLRRGVQIVEQAKAMQSGLGKALRYCMSHTSGKLHIVGMLHDNELLLQYHEAHNTANLGRMLTIPLQEGQAWVTEDNMAEG